jgi:hypothetical protein
MKDLDIVTVFKGTTIDPKLALVSMMSASGPVMGHVNQSHPFQGKQFPVARVSQFVVSDGTDCACFADKAVPLSDVWETKTSAILVSTDKRGSHGNTLSVKSATTGSGLNTISKGKAGIREVTVEEAVVI